MNNSYRVIEWIKCHKYFIALLQETNLKEVEKIILKRKRAHLLIQLQCCIVLGYIKKHYIVITLVIDDLTENVRR